MKVFLALVIGILVGAGAFWYFSTTQGRTQAKAAADHLQGAAVSARDVVQEKLRILDLRTNDIKEELSRTGTIVRRKAKEASQAIADATADARTTTSIKTKLIASRDLSGMSISVNTTAGVVTLSGFVSSPDQIGKAMLLAMDTDGVSEVISTLQVRPKAKP